MRAELFGVAKGGALRSYAPMFRALLLLLIFSTSPALAQEELSAQDHADIARVEAYLNQLTTLKSRFVQIASTGNLANGTFYLSRPGRMRFEYDPPTPVLMVADGTWLIFQDLELEQVSHLPLSRTPLGVLVDETVKLSDKLDVLQVDRGPKVLRVRMRMKEDPDAGEVQLIFSEAPMMLRQWVVTDAQEVQIRVTLQNIVFGVPLSDDLFRLPVEVDKENDPGG